MHKPASSIRILLSALALGATGTLPAQASVIFQDTFDTDATRSILNYNSFANWTVSGGTVDYLRSGGYDISCMGNTGGCVDLDGSTRDAGRMTSRTSFDFLAGVVYTFEIMASGNQRNTALDGLIMGVTAGGSQTFTGIAGNMPYAPLTYSFSFANNTRSSIFLEGLGGDNIGIVIDNVALRSAPVTSVPEPGTLALFALGLAGVGMAARRRIGPGKA